MSRSQYSEMFISTYIPTYKGNSLRKSLHNHCCYFGFTFEVRFSHVISCIYIAIAKSGNANSQVSKPKALMCCFSQLISVSLGSFNVNCTDNISTLENPITYVKKIVTAILLRRCILQCSRASRLLQEFCSIFTIEDVSVIPWLGRSPVKITPIQVQLHGVKKLLVQLKPRKASGPDRLLAHELAPSLTALYNQSLSTQVLPEDWKRAFISPV